jgi:hypothetical protein
MTEKMTVQKLAGEFQRAYESGETSKDTVEKFCTLYGANLTIEAAFLWRERLKFKKAEQNVEYERDKLQLDEAQKILAGLPPETTFKEAARIKAAQGDPLAQRIHAELTSPKARTQEALFYAAVKLHPEWKHLSEDEVLDKLADSTDMNDQWNAVVEWLYANHPKVARRIESKFKQEE